MADRGAFRLLLPRPSVILNFSHLHVWRFRNPRFLNSCSHPLYCSSSPRSTTVVLLASLKVITLNHRRLSYKISAATEELGEGGRYGRTERGKRGRKRRQLWEELFEDNVEDDDNGYGSGGGSRNIEPWRIIDEVVDNVWILKAFKSYGYLLPFIILSLFFSTGPKAFLMALGVSIVPSLLFIAFQKLIGWDRRRRTTTRTNQFYVQEEEMESRRSRFQNNSSSVRNNDNGRGVQADSARMASRFGGWDELDDLRTIPEQPRAAKSEPKRKPMRSRTKRKRVRREEAAEPLLLRLLVSLFPFLSSLTNMLKK